MKTQMIRKLIIALVLSAIPIVGLVENGIDASYILPVLFIVIWIIGEVYAAPYYLKKAESNLTSILKLSIISFLAIGSNVIMVIAFIVYCLYFAAFGWITGWILLFRDIIP